MKEGKKEEKRFEKKERIKWRREISEVGGNRGLVYEISKRGEGGVEIRLIVTSFLPLYLFLFSYNLMQKKYTK